MLNIKNRVAKSGPLQGQRHPYVYQLVIALQHQGWHWLEPYIWSKPNAVPGRYGPRTKDGRLSRGNPPPDRPRPLVLHPVRNGITSQLHRPLCWLRKR